MKLKLGITAGDTNGVGYEVILKTLAEPYVLDICTPIIYGSLKTANIHRKTLEGVNLNFLQINKPDEAMAQRVNIINCTTDNQPVEFGVPSAVAGKAAYQALKRACSDMKAGSIDALVTAPINKDTIQSDEFHFSGHTEYLESEFGKGKTSLMMLVSETMRVALVTNHTPVAEVAATITKEKILQKLQVFNAALRDDFNIIKPRIAVLALNPHAGDNGLLGKEEADIIEPAIAAANEQGIVAVGPYAADGFFGAGHFRHFDGILAMYHDQGLIPFKTINMHNGVNYTAGLDIIRTSPDHGTGYDIAGKGIASEQSFRAALFAAVDIYARRKENRELRANPLLIHEKKLNNKE